MKKIALITSGYMPVPASLGGAVECLDDYLINQNETEQRCNIDVFSCYEAEAEKIAAALRSTSVKFIKTPVILKLGDLIIYNIIRILRPHSQTMSYRYILKRLYFISKVAKILHVENYDEVMLENHATLLMIMKKYKNHKKYKGRFIYHLHNEQNNLYGCEDVLKDAKFVATVSEYISKCIRSKVPELKDSQIKIWKNCVDSTKFGSDSAKLKAEQLKIKYNIPKDKILILFTGRLSPEKGIRELLMAFKDCHNNNLHLIIAGGYFSGNDKIKNVYEEELKRLTMSIKDKITFTGFVDYKEVPALYMMSDIVIVPSTWNDPAPLTVIEAITSGKPLITTESGGIPEYANKNCAILLARNNCLVDELTNAIEELASDENKRNKMSIAALNTSKSWSIPQYYKTFVEMID